MGRSITNRNVLDSIIELFSTRIINFRRRRITNAADAIDPQDYVTLKQLLSAIAGITPGGGSGGTHQHQSYTMNAAPYSVPDVTVVNGDTLTIYLVQDGSGGRYPTWNAAVYENAPTVFTGTAGLTGIVGFFGNGGKWKWDGRHVQGF